MPWYGHNFEDAIVLSERLVKDDVYSSIHIQELELHVRDTKRGQEEITREIPNVSEEALLDLDERGIVRIGAHVKPGDILVGKITPKGETELSPEEKLLTAIFGEKAKDVKDSSLKVPPGMEGVVIDVKIFSRIEDQVVEKDRGERIGEVRRLEGEEKIRVNEVRDAELVEMLDGQVIALALKAGTVEEAIPAGTKLTSASAPRDASVDDRPQDVPRREQEASTSRCVRSSTRRTKRRREIEEKAEERIDRILQPDELPPGVIQLVKVYLAEKRKISVGDKMAGRHGNKGIVARIVPEEDMPFLPDGRPVDIVLNPLGVPSRMNVGQILETHLGWVARILGFYAKTPVFQGDERARDRPAAEAGRRDVGRATRSDCARRRRRSRTRTSARCWRTSSPTCRADDEVFMRLQDATLNELGGARHVAGDARHVPPRARLPRRRGEGTRRARGDGDREPDRVPRRRGSTTRRSRRRSAPSTRRRSRQLEKRKALDARRIAERPGVAGARGDARQEVGSRRRRGGGRAHAARRAERRTARCGCATDARASTSRRR